MNTQMYENPVTQDNLRILREYGWQVVEPASGHLACGDSGKGKLPEPEVLLDWILQTIAREKDMAGLRCWSPPAHPGGPGPGAVSHQPLLRENGLRHCQGCRPPGRPGNAGHRPHRPPASPVRGDCGDYFSGGYVPGSHRPGPGADIIIKAGGVADYTPVQVAQDKVKKSDNDLSIPLKRTQDILQYLGDHRREGQFLCGFSMETRDMVENSRKKLRKNMWT